MLGGSEQGMGRHKFRGVVNHGGSLGGGDTYGELEWEHLSLRVQIPGTIPLLTTDTHEGPIYVSYTDLLPWMFILLQNPWSSFVVEIEYILFQ